MRPTRRRDLLQILRGGRASSQKEIVQVLRSRGHDVTQATVSRDLRELGAMKVRTTDGFAYRLRDDISGLSATDLIAHRLEQFMREFIIDVRTAGLLVIILTPPGSASIVARAVDQAALDEVVGTIAGDDTIFIATNSEMAARRLAKRWLSTDSSTMEEAH